MRAIYFVMGSIFYCSLATGSPYIGLYKTYQDASSNNPDISASRSELNVSQEEIPQAMAGLLPSLSAEGSFSNTATDGLQNDQSLKRDGTDYKLTLNQPIFRADRWFRYFGAKKRVDQALLKLSAEEQDFIMKSAETYITVLVSRDELTAISNETEALNKQLIQVRQRYIIGIATQAELYQAQAIVDATNANKIASSRKLQDATEDLYTFTHVHYDNVHSISERFPIKEPFPDSVERWIDGALQNNLKLQASLQDVSAARDQLDEYKSQHLPSVDMVAQIAHGDNDSFGYTNQYASTQYRDHIEQRSLSIQLTIPIFSGGATQSKVREGVGRLSISEDNLASLKWQIVSSTRNFYRAITTETLQLEVLRQSILSNRAAVKATQVGYDIGTGSLVDLLNAQRQLYQAIRNYSSTRYNYILDTLHLKQVVGTLSTDDLRSVDQYIDNL
ncbi:MULTISPECIES: TolC family outer membrane protein [Pseudomonas syringae group]|nr:MULTISPECIES: TolC family outer membrane protein [Pseudomonas syringae group]MEE3917286.1 TolC family outer membrane protein [Pseudomonas viridiflava]MEE3976022.1 TolC family outer membrane protein [Pseudomonas viridiflava]MEE4021080.1 TolC family outer membrane protein [Pseudomonas viridiflava]MEE4048930.1 TolC family outer membrane protein [Pseudomonas viridiflava]